MEGPPSLYAAFDRFPAPKGAAVHIDRFARTLFATFGGGLLYVLGDERLPAGQREPGGVEIVRFGAFAPTALERGLAYGRRLSALLRERGGALELAHFRDPWGGVPILAAGLRCPAVYEVNGLPSIELPAHRPWMAPRTVGEARRGGGVLPRARGPRRHAVARRSPATSYATAACRPGGST